MNNLSRSDNSRIHKRHSSFKRYCEYEGFQSLNHSKQQPEYKQSVQQVQTQIIMMPPPKQIRSKTSCQARISFKNIGQNFESKPKLGQRNAYSRQNIHLMNKKIKRMKQAIYGSNNTDMKSPDKDIVNSITLTGSSKLFQRYQSGDRFTRSISSSVNLRKNKYFESEQNTEQQHLTPKISKIYGSMRQKSGKQIVNKRTQILSKPSVEPHKFKTTLKKKHIDDNPKVLVNIIRKKVQAMDQQQIHNYIKCLMRRTR